MTTINHDRLGRSRGARLWPPPEGMGLAFAATGTLYVSHFFYAGLYLATAMTLVLASGLILAGILLHPGLRRELTSRRDLTSPAVLYGLVLLVTAWMLTPYIPGGPHPIWAYVGEQPAGTVDRSATILEMVKLLGLGCMFLVGAASGNSDRRARTALSLLLGFGVLFGLWAAILWATGAENPSSGHRLSAHFGTANTAATLFGVLLVVSLGGLLRRRGEATTETVASAAPFAGAAVAFATLLLMTVSRGGLLSTLGGVTAFLSLMIVSGRLKLRRGALISLAIVLTLSALMLFGGDRVLDRLAQSSRDAFTRTDMLKAHWPAFLASPLFGYGQGTFDTVNRTLIDAANLQVLGETRMMHNVYLTWLEQAGLVGAIPMFLCIGAIMWRTLRGALQRSRMTSLLYALLATDVIFLLHGLTDFALETPSMAATWAWLLGLQFGLSKGSSR